tara:strand:+ start:281148 stop:281375 length:228 start_codon:yes stop_codon:yes gene_type:complete
MAVARQPYRNSGYLRAASLSGETKPFGDRQCPIGRPRTITCHNNQIAGKAPWMVYSRAKQSISLLAFDRPKTAVD